MLGYCCVASRLLYTGCAVALRAMRRASPRPHSPTSHILYRQLCINEKKKIISLVRKKVQRRAGREHTHSARSHRASHQPPATHIPQLSYAHNMMHTGTYIHKLWAPRDKQESVESIVKKQSIARLLDKSVLASCALLYSSLP